MALLDEATSSLSSELEHSLMQQCKDLEITLVSVGHRESLTKWHHKLLKIRGDQEGSWSVSHII